MAITHLPDGRPLRLRPLDPDDGDRLRRLGRRLSPQTVYRRFLSPLPSCEWMLPRLLDVDHRDREAIVALQGDEIVGVARYVVQPDAAAADIAVVVADDWQRHGVGMLLMRRLARLARRRGVRSFTGDIAGENVAALHLLTVLSPSVRARFASGTAEFEIDLEPPPPPS